MNQLALFFAGLLFAIGLGVSGMTDATKVIGFLDLSNGWDPSLGLVMAGAIGVHFPLYRWLTGGATKRRPLFAASFQIPTRQDITPRLVGGAALFGAGWALGGFCPGPALVSSTTGGTALVFVAAMSAGMALFHIYEAVAAEWTTASAASKNAANTSASAGPKAA